MSRREASIMLALALLLGAAGCTQRGQVASRAGHDTPDAAPDTGVVREDVDAGRDAGPPAASTCEEACEHLAACFGDEIVSPCVDGCDDERSSAIILYCEAQASGCTYPDGCTPGSGWGSGSREQCSVSCDALEFFHCIEADAKAMCVSACATAPVARVDQFNDCVTAACTDDSCYRLLVPDAPPPSPVTACRRGCDNLLSSLCIDGFQHGDCYSLCESETGVSLDAFIACSADFCTGPDCYERFAWSAL